MPEPIVGDQAGGVFTDDFIDACIGLKKEVTQFRAATRPLEYQM